MKNIKFWLGLAVSALLFSSCEDFLDRQPDNKITEEECFSRYEKVDGMVTTLYEYAKIANRPLLWLNDFPSSTITDECTAYGTANQAPHHYHTGNIAAERVPPGGGEKWWWSVYKYIRHANKTLEGIAMYNTPDNPEEDGQGDLNRRIGEIYFMRAYYYFVLIREYGECVYLDRSITPQDDYDLPKSSVHEIVEHIVADCDSAFKRVYWMAPIEQFGRVDKGACLGLKAMALWTVAQPLWNGGQLPNDTRDFKDEYRTYKPERMERAKKALKEVLDFKLETGEPRYSLYEKYNKDDYTDSQNKDGKAANNYMVPRRLWNMYFDTDAIKNEWVWFVTRHKDSGFCGDNLPPSQYSGQARNRPLQEQVDEYEIIIDGYGYPIWSEKAKGIYDDGNPYVNRDPRFYRDIIYHGCTFRGEIINTAEGSNKVGDSYLSKQSHSGYYFRKYTKEGWNKTTAYQIHGPAVIDLTQIIYNYCECVNELTGPNQEIYDLINKVRARSFMVPMPPEVKNDQKLMREYIKRERRVELFSANERIWTMRLQMDPDNPDELTKEATYKDAYSYPYPKTGHFSHGMRPVEDPNGKIVVKGKKYRMERFSLNENRVWVSPRHYLWPLMDDDIKRSTKLTQNPGW